MLKGYAQSFEDNMEAALGAGWRPDTWYYGGEKDRHARYVAMHSEILELPEHSDACMCGHPISEQCYVIHEPSKTLLVVGNCCIKKFLRERSGRTCETCHAPHRNRLDNFCNACRSQRRRQRWFRHAQLDQQALRFVVQQRRERESAARVRLQAEQANKERLQTERQTIADAKVDAQNAIIREFWEHMGSVGPIFLKKYSPVA